MKKQLLSFCFLSCLLFISYHSFTGSSGAPTGNSGAPGDGNCTGCHSGSIITSGTNWNNLSISSNVPISGYFPGNSYTITVTQTVPGINKWGFQALILTIPGNAQAGALSAGTGSQINIAAGKQYATHTGSSNTGSGTRTWSFNWIAPASGTGDVRVYVNVNAANGTGGTDGDQIYAKTLTIIEQTDKPSATIGGLPGNNTICLGDTLRLQGGGMNNPTGFSWTFTGLTSSSQQNPTVVFTTTGPKTITLITSNQFGNSSQTSVAVMVVNKPSFTVSPGININKCGEDTVTLLTSASQAFSFLWTPGNSTTAALKVVDSGNYTVRVTNPNNGCFTVSPVIRVNKLPKPIPVLTTDQDTACVSDTLLVSGSQGFNSYSFFLGSTLVQNSANPVFDTTLTPGIKPIGLLVSNGSCNSDTIRKTILVAVPLSAPVITCGASTTSSVTFNWQAILGSNGYEVSLDTGKTWLNNGTNTSYTITGMSPNSTRRIWVRAVGGLACDEGLIGSQICTNGACTPIRYVVSTVSQICLDSATQGQEIQVAVGSLSISSFVIQFDNEPVGTTQLYRKSVILGNNTVRIQIIDTSNIGCPQVDTSFVIRGIFPIEQRPKLISNTLCTSDSALHAYVILNADQRANRFQLFRNAEVEPFLFANASSDSSMALSLLRVNYQIASGDRVYALAIDTNTGCSLVSDSIIVNLLTSPIPGFSWVRNDKSVTLTDTTSGSVQRNWFFAGVIPNQLNAQATITAPFPAGGTYTVSLEMMDQQGCMAKVDQQVIVFNSAINEVMETDLKVYPNPVKDFIELDIRGADKPDRVIIMDARGKTVLKQSFTKGMILNVAHLSPGCYTLQVIGVQGSIQKRIVKE